MGTLGQKQMNRDGNKCAPSSRHSRHHSLISVLATLGLLTLAHIGLAKSAKIVPKQFYVVIIDAGSQASRAIAYSFHKSVINDNLVLDDELFLQIKPGLSAYAKTPQNVRQPLEQLLDEVKQHVPESEWSCTPLVMRATAGLRLLPKDEARNILDESRRTLGDSGFLLAEDAVEMMSGSDEGLFSWLSVNFLEERLFSGSTAKTVAALDLGGGSAQLSFSLTPAELETVLASNYANSVKHVKIFGRNLTVFAHSSLGLGLMAARKAILKHSVNAGSDYGKELRSACIHPSVKRVPWSYENENYLVSGFWDSLPKIVPNQITDDLKNVPVGYFAECLEIIRDVVNASIPIGLPNAMNHEIYAFSNYFKKAKEVGLINSKLGDITLESFYKEAEKACRTPNRDQPFMCLDISYIYVLLHNGYGIDDATTIHLRKEIKGHTLTWALGAAFNVLDLDSRNVLIDN